MIGRTWMAGCFGGVWSTLQRPDSGSQPLASTGISGIPIRTSGMSVSQLRKKPDRYPAVASGLSQFEVAKRPRDTRHDI